MLQEKVFIEGEFHEPCNQDCAFCFLNYTDILSENNLFSGLSRHEIAAIIKAVHHRVREFEKNSIVAMEGESIQQLMMLVEGSVVGEMMDYEGNILRVETIGSSQSIATAFLFGNKAALPVTVIALEPTRILMIEKDELLKLFSKNKQVMKNFLDSISERAQFLSKRIKLLTLPDLKSKLAFYILSIHKKTASNSFRIEESQQELAEMLGTTRPSVGRSMRDLHNEGFIEARGKEITIKNRAGLSSLLGK